MTRVTPIHKPGDYPGAPSTQTQQELADLFGYLFPGQAEPEIDHAHLGVAIAAQNPKLALELAKLSRFIALDLPWSQRIDLRELAIQTVNSHFNCDYAFSVRMPTAVAAGISADMQAALSCRDSSNLFDDEQKLVIAYSHGVASGNVPGELFNQVKIRYGEKGAVEFTTLVGFWSFWAMFLNATGLEG